jgi:hypothetical protein
MVQNNVSNVGVDKVNVVSSNAGSYKQPLTAIGVDGKDHINVWEKGSTELGRNLSHISYFPFVHSEYGKFKTMEGFWHYIRSKNKDDNLRQLSGTKARKLGESLDICRVPNFKKVIMDANWQKIKAYPDLINDLKNLELPLDGYYIRAANKDLRIRFVSSSWILPGLEEIRKAILENRSPDFSFLVETPNKKFN